MEGAEVLYFYAGFVLHGPLQPLSVTLCALGGPPMTSASQPKTTRNKLAIQQSWVLTHSMRDNSCQRNSGAAPNKGAELSQDSGGEGWSLNKFIYLFLEREEGRERNIDVQEKHLLAASCTHLDLEPDMQPRHVP